MIKYAREKSLINKLILEKIDKLRLKRNPFVHPKDWDYPYNLSHRILENITQPHEQLEVDATEAIQVIFYLTTYKL
jgi:hypothetical protein